MFPNFSSSTEKDSDRQKVGNKIVHVALNLFLIAEELTLLIVSGSNNKCMCNGCDDERRRDKKRRALKGGREEWTWRGKCKYSRLSLRVRRTKKKTFDHRGSDKFMAGHTWTCRSFVSYLGPRVRCPASFRVGRPSLEHSS